MLYTSKQAKQNNIEDGIKHPTQKPIRLTKKLLDACIDPSVDSKVVIPFAGTGSESRACEERGVEWISFDINDDYVKMANLLVKNGFPK